MTKKLDVALVVPGLPFNGDTLKKQGLGGSETAAIYMAKGLARNGANVIVFCNVGEPSLDEDNVRYLPLGAWQQYSKGTQHDVAIVQRAPELIAMQTKSRLNVLWMHDLAIVRAGQTFKSAMWNVDFTFVLSEFMLEQYKKVYGLQEDAFRLTRNGIDLSLFRPDQSVKRDRHHIVYAARPERGLDVLVEKIMPELIRRDPRFHLTVCGYENSVEHWVPFYERCKRGLKALGPGNVHAGSLTKKQLYRLYESAGCYAYPTPSPEMPEFNEVSCITAMECQAAGLPVVTNDRGALAETLAPGTGVLLPVVMAGGLPVYGESFVAKFCDAIQTYAEDDDAFANACDTGREAARRLDWDAVAKDWMAIFESEIRERNNDPDRLVRHMHQTSDIVAAKQWMKDAPQDFKDLAALERLMKPFDFMDEEDGYRKQYERIGATHDDWVYDAAPREPRFAMLRQWLTENKKDIKTVLDYGCAHGAYAIGLAQQLPHLRIHGVDIDHFSTDMATEWAAKREVEDRATFSVWTHDADATGAKYVHFERKESLYEYDAALLQEVLEHVPEPWAVIESVEKQVKKGGKVYITVPFGPWEYSSYHNYPWRCHVWHFDKHDILDMVGKKKNLVIDSYVAGDSPELGDTQGWWILSYDADHESIGQIDLQRKRWLARPRQTVSVMMIAGGDSVIETLMWSLRALYHVADEIVIADCGVPELQRPAEEEGVENHLDVAVGLLQDAEPHADWRGKIRIVKGCDPKKEGFEVARNMALDECKMDWVLWIDHDERLMDPVVIHKYLRENNYQGYGMRQHHLAIDAVIPPDMPVRLFRRRQREYDGKQLRFYGALHEHPELGLNEGPGEVVVLADGNIAHLGYLTESVRQRRFARNFPLLQLDEQRYPDRLLQKFFLMRDKVQLARFELHQNGGVATGQIKALMREVVNLGSEHFVGKGNYMNSDALAYYSEALEILGEGFAASFSIEADKVEAKPNGTATYRFANKEDFMAEFTKRASDKIDPIVGEYY